MAGIFPQWETKRAKPREGPRCKLSPQETEVTRFWNTQGEAGARPWRAAALRAGEPAATVAGKRGASTKQKQSVEMQNLELW